MKKRIGIIGFGWIARDVHLPNYRTIPDECEITAVCDIKETARQNAKDKTGLPDECIFEDYKALCDSGLCDAVDICTPNYLHCEIAKYALSKGLGVSIEKPVGMNRQEVMEVDALAKEKNLPVFVCFTWRHRATLRFLKDLADKGEVGELCHIYIRCIKDSGLWKGRRLEWRFQKEKSGTGVLCDLGSHMIDLLGWFGVPPVGLSANYGTVVKQRQLEDSDEWGEVTTDDWSNIIFDLKDGVSANITLSRACATISGLVQVEIYGKNGRLVFNEAERKIVTKQLTGEKEEKLEVPAEYGNPDVIAQCKSFIGLLSGKTDVYTSTLKEGLEAQRIIDAAEISGREKRYVYMSEVQ